ncbi:uncharacterized protein DFL_004357 [Arthrobotrys flagrans]|uniref:Uncharacterized protein n=1 Tax=Arthrobotrys flagrans TaxID=97331 RepID=A0A437A4M7_ARTFL|nr:hypothetical protein DFL_004357 [Arthrobotrys flagrans]
MRTLATRRAYAKALKTKDEKDIEAAKKSIHQELELLEDPSDPYTIVFHRFMGDEMAECYSNLGDKVRADRHRKICKEIYEEQEKSWASQNVEEEALNLLAAMQIALQGVDLWASPEGWTKQVFERVPMKGDSKSEDSL